jgi:hypothetical protein
MPATVFQATPPISFLKDNEKFQFITVKWDADIPEQVFLWHKLHDAPWKPVHPTVPNGDIPSPDGRKGHYQQSVDAGVYQAVAFLDANINPNHASTFTDPGPLGFALCLVLRDHVDTLLDREELGSGGTWTGWGPIATEPTFAFMRVSTTEPLHPDTPADVAPEWLDFPQIDGTGALTEVFDQGSNVQLGINHAIEIAPPGLPTGPAGLLPGRDYWRLELLVALDGRWQINKRQVQLKNRTVTIILKEIFIVDDGADGDGEASFKIWVVDGVTFASACYLPDRTISDEPDPGHEDEEHIALSADCQVPITLGPRFIASDRDYRVAILTRAIGKHAIGTDDISGNVDPQPDDKPPVGIGRSAFLVFRTGSNQTGGELADGPLQPFSIPGDPISADNEFSYQIHGTYSVTYN